MVNVRVSFKSYFRSIVILPVLQLCQTVTALIDRPTSGLRFSSRTDTLSVSGLTICVTLLSLLLFTACLSLCACPAMAVLLRRVGRVALQLSLRQTWTPRTAALPATFLAADRSSQSEAAMSGFNLLHLITNAKPVTLKPCGLPSGTCRTKKTWPKSFSQEELKKRLSPMQFHVTQERGTESAFRGEYTEHKEDGIYTCVVCGAQLFKSETKFDSGSGWPSFYDLVKEESVTVTDDFSYGMHRVETSCNQCGSHLGHLFDDGPRPTGKRYCINSASLGFQSASASASSPPSNGEGSGTGAGAGPGGAVGGKTEL